MLRLLLIDDQATTGNLVRDCFKGRYEVVWATTCAKAYELIGQASVDLILLESRLPDGGGLELLATIRRAHHDTPAIMLTRYGSENVCASAFKLGVQDYFKKPIDRKTLIAAVQRVAPVMSRPPEPPRAPVLDAVVQSLTRAVTGGVDRDEQRIRDAVTFLEEHYREPLPLDRVAGTVGMGRFTFSHKFTAVMHVSFRTYLLRVRVTHAGDLLRQPLHSVTDVAQMVGFGDLSRFNKMFKKYVGMPPTAYRELAVTTNIKKKANP